MKFVSAVSGVPVRLTDERMSHIERRHPEMKGEEDRILETVTTPDYVQQGDTGTLLAIKHYPKTPLTEKFYAVVYRELSQSDGFVVTAYLTSRPSVGRRIIWKP